MARMLNLEMQLVRQSEGSHSWQAESQEVRQYIARLTKYRPAAAVWRYRFFVRGCCDAHRLVFLAGAIWGSHLGTRLQVQLLQRELHGLVSSWQQMALDLRG
jgi:hypothetical protein